MNKLRKETKKFDIYTFTKTTEFLSQGQFSDEIIKKIFNFAYGMSFGNTGEHRNTRSGGSYKRKNGEVFADTFQGKLAEFGIYEILQNKGIDLEEPDLVTYSLGDWDSGDIKIKDLNFSVKSTKSYGQLLLLEEKDWDDDGQYIPDISRNGGKYDGFIFVRIDPFATEILKKGKKLYNNKVDKNDLYNKITEETFSYEVAGYVSNKLFKKAINEKLIIPQGAYLNNICKKNKMDASNYYVQAGDMDDIDKLVGLIRNKEE